MVRRCWFCCLAVPRPAERALERRSTDPDAALLDTGAHEHRAFSDGRRLTIDGTLRQKSGVLSYTRVLVRAASGR